MLKVGMITWLVLFSILVLMWALIGADYMPWFCEGGRARSVSFLRVPYRWFYWHDGRLKTGAWTNITYLWSDLVNGVRNVVRWTPVIWYDVDWDRDALLEIMETKLRWMAKSSEKWPTRDHERAKRQMLVCADLLRRLLADDYFQNAGYEAESWKSLPSYRRVQIAKHAGKQPRVDLDHLAKIFSRHVLGWWS